MDTERERKLIDLLNKYDTGSVPFAKARGEILAKGFTEAELVYALYSAPFDGKVNKPRQENPLQKFYEQNPEKADKVAKILLLNQAQTNQDKITADAAASQFGDIQSRSYYEVRTADRLGIPYFALMLVTIALLIVAIKLKLSKQTIDIVFLIVSLAINAVFIFKFIQERMRVSKLRKDIRKNNN